MGAIDDAAALVALKDWSNAVGTYWSFYNAIGLGAVGFAINLGKEAATKRSRLLLAFGFLACAFGNHFALIRSHTIMVEVATALRIRANQADSIDALPRSSSSAPGLALGSAQPLTATPVEYRRLMRVAPPVVVWKVRAFHITLSLLIAVVIWFASEPRVKADAAKG